MATQEGLPAKSVSPEGVAYLKKYNWPGNVRELENLMRRIAALYNDEVIGSDILHQELSDLAPAEAAPVSTQNATTISESVELHLTHYFNQFGGALPPAGLYDRVLKELEEPLIRQALAVTNGNQIKTAELLGLNRNTLRKKIVN